MFLGRQLCKEMFLTGNPDQAMAKGLERISWIVSELCQGMTSSRADQGVAKDLGFSPRAKQRFIRG
jgi:hypothetical protein